MVALVFFLPAAQGPERHQQHRTGRDRRRKRIFEVLDTEPEIRSAPNATGLARDFRTIDFRNVSFRYEEAPVLRNINLTVRAGETIAIVGKSGGGKTTLVNLIRGSMTCQTGRS